MLGADPGLERSRSDGFDYRASANTVVFVNQTFDPLFPSEVLVSYAGVTGEAFTNPAKGKELALAQYALVAIDRDIGVRSGTGLFAAITETEGQLNVQYEELQAEYVDTVRVAADLLTNRMFLSIGLVLQV